MISQGITVIYLLTPLRKPKMHPQTSNEISQKIDSRITQNIQVKL